ncbi:hypothetical protein CSUI_010761 [Cystoisospora suis]|uniref:Uncharacterized protein n=1 Tax=Cystoisospora suis TaxID=483139 RepID=A0A2C6J9E6_9APIC|nr:hypothetical protein CSUI_010761 [Cystoisospora suis]
MLTRKREVESSRSDAFDHPRVVSLPLPLRRFDSLRVGNAEERVSSSPTFFLFSSHPTSPSLSVVPRKEWEKESFSDAVLLARRDD